MYRVGEAANGLQGFITMLELNNASSLGLSFFVLHRNKVMTICQT